MTPHGQRSVENGSVTKSEVIVRQIGLREINNNKKGGLGLNLDIRHNWVTKR
jgi:hypothetical protein